MLNFRRALLLLGGHLLLARTLVGVGTVAAHSHGGQRQPEELGSCRMCGWQRSCEDMCVAAQDQCVFTWVEGQGDQCMLTFPLLQLAAEAKHVPGRLVTANVTYQLHKDMLSDLLHRYNQVRLMKAHGHAVGAGWPSSQAQQWVRHSVGLALPRVALAWRLVVGPAAAVLPTCCHQECFWEEMYRESDMPSLQSLLSKSVAAWKVQLDNPNQCRYAPYGMSSVGGSLLALAQAVAAQARTPLASGAALLQRAAALGPARWLAGLMFPALLIAYEAAQACADQPLLVVYMACVALLRSLLDAYHVWRMLFGRQGSLQARAMCEACHALLGGLLMLMLCGLAAAWLSLLGSPAHHRLLFALPMLHMLLMVAARQLLWGHTTLPELRGLTQSQFDAWVRRHLGALRLHAAAAGAAPTAAAGSPGAAARVAAAASTRRGMAGSSQLSARLLSAAAAADGELLDSFEHYLLPSPNAAPLSTLLADALAQVNGPARAVVLRRYPGTYSPVTGGLASRQAAPGMAAAAQPLGPGHRGAPPRVRLSEAWVAGVGASTGIAAQQVGAVGLDGVAGLEAAGGNHMAEGQTLASVLDMLHQHQWQGGPDAPGPAPAPQAPLPQSPHELAAAVAAAAAAAVHDAAGVAAGAAAAGAQAAGQQQQGQGHGGAVPTARQAAAQAAMAAIHWPPPLELPAWLDDVASIPHAFRCPITLSLMREPTQASSGVTYEKAAIFQWLQLHRVDPVTHVPLKRHRLTPNLNLRHMIEDWAAAQVEPASSTASEA